MAIVKTGTTTSLKIKVETGTNANGQAVYSTRSISKINPELSDSDLYAIGNGFGEMQCFVVGGVVRADSAELLEE